MEWTYVVIYSRLCYDLDMELPQKTESNENFNKTENTSVTSVFRSKLLDKCRKIFKDDLANLETYVNVKDPEEKEDKIKKFTLGSNFIKI